MQKKAEYVTSASLTSQINNLKSQHIAIEVTGIDNKTKKSANDILALKNELEKKEYDISENEIGMSNLFISLPTFRVYYTYYQGTAFKSFTFHFY